MIVGHKNKYTLTDKEVIELRETHYLIRYYLDEKKRLKPVSVEVCAKALCAESGMRWNAVSAYHFRDNVKAVLNSAGVPYVD